MSEAPRLLILPSVTGRAEHDGVLITRKFVEGVTAYTAQWPGPVSVVLHPASSSSSNLDEDFFRPAELPFHLTVEPQIPETFERIIPTAGVVLGSLGARQLCLSRVCARQRVPCVYVAELTLRTRLQIGAIKRRNPLRRARHAAWQLGYERRQIASVRRAAGVQCNGVPIHRSLSRFNKNAMLYFDTRMSEELMATRKMINSRRTTGPLRLAFSGRLIPIKGALDLIDVARHLHRLGTDFQFDIFGDGECREEMQRRIEAAELSSFVRLRGTLRFSTELVPALRANADLFVCCHKQGDPSCTYLETMGCGVPVVGYANEALEGIVRASGVGWTTPMSALRLAQRIHNLASQRTVLIDAATDSLNFARQHSFEKTFHSRIQHLRRTAAESRFDRKSSLEVADHG